MVAKSCVAICFTAFLSGAAFAQTPPEPKAETPQAQDDNGATNMMPPAVGDHWTYEMRDNISGDLKGDGTQTVTDVKGDEISIQSHALGASGVTYLVYDRQWNLKRNPLWKYTPNDGSGVKESMKPNDKWNFKTTDLKDARSLWRRTGFVKVTGQETVTTQAGTFDAIKYETTVHIRGVINPTKKAEVTMTTWYVHSVDHWVKRTEKLVSDGHVRNNITVELVDYGRQ